MRRFSPIDHHVVWETGMVIDIPGSDLEEKTRQCVRLLFTCKGHDCGLGNEDPSIQWSLIAQHPPQGVFIMSSHPSFIAGAALGPHPHQISPMPKEY